MQERVDHERVLHVDEHPDGRIDSRERRETGRLGRLPPSPGSTAARDLTDANVGATQVRTLLLKDEVIGEYVNAPLVPGLTFGWSPEPLQAVAYVAHSHRLMLMDVVSGAKQEVSATSDVLLPAWSPDGSQIVFLQKTSRKTFALMRVTVTRP